MKSQPKSPPSIPLLRWAGSKRKLVSTILHLVDGDFERYVEPFAGSGCVFFALRPKRAVLGDFNRELMSTYEAIRRHPILIHRKAAAWKPTRATYYKVRNTTPDCPLDRAARFVYLNRFCFNGVYRTNRLGQFNVPFGERTGALPDAHHFLRAAALLRRAELRPVDFEVCLNDVGCGDLVYLDPPYATTSRVNGGEYGHGAFAPPDLPRLLAALRQIDKTGAAFILSYADCHILRGMLGPWKVVEIDVPRHVAGFTRHRARAREILVTNKHG